MLSNSSQRVTRIAHRAYRQTKPVTHTLLAMLVTVAIFMSSVSVSPTRAAPVVGQGFTVTAADLAFILKQIKIAEAHALAANPDPTGDPANCQALLGNGPNQIQNPLLSVGLRTVDGACNNLLPGPGTFDAKDQAFLRLTTPVFRAAENASAFGGPTASTYAQTSGPVADSQPRLISNLIVDQTSANLAAVAAAGFPVRSQGVAGIFPCATVPGSNPPIDIVPATPVGCVPAFQTLFIENVTTDSLSQPFNSLFAIFGQFFDHGLDKITNGDNGAVFVPLKADDPLVAGPDHIFGNADDLPVAKRFMVMTRGTIVTGPDGVRSAPNTDTPFVDQSQTYTSHSSHQVFTREYVNNTAGKPVSTGKFLHRADGGLPTWAMVKTQAANLLGLKLTDANVGNIPMIAADPYGNFFPGPARGLPQYVTASGLVEGNRAHPVAVPANATFINTAFLNDIAHSAAPTFSGGVLNPDSNTTVGGSLDTPSSKGSYDDELLNLHFICGDGRCNENIALSAVHQIFHSEHDRLVAHIKNVLTNDASATGVAALPAWRLAAGAAGWNGERLFQAARFVTEMEYQYLVFDEFARKIRPTINPFAFNQTDVNPTITAELANAVYRFGHSMLTDTIARKNEVGSVPSCTPTDSPTCLNNDIPLLDGFLNPASYYDGGPAGSLTSQAAAGSIITGLSDQPGNDIDEFVADTLRNHLLGLPLDLSSINIARARSEGVPSLNNVRRQIFAATNDGQMRPYINWVDFGQSLKHPESLVNFVAAYGKHPTITAQATLAGKRVAADQIVNGTTLPGPDGILFDNPATARIDESADNILPPDDLGDFMFSIAAWANVGNVSGTGLDDIDLWVGGLAEQSNLFGGLLGTTFNYVFENQLTNLQNGDRFYYLARTQDMNLRAQLEGNSFTDLVMRNTNVTLKADAFATADCKFELGRLTFPASVGSFITGPDSVNDDPSSACDENRLLLRQPDGTFRYREQDPVDPSASNSVKATTTSGADVIVTALSYANGIFTSTVKNRGTVAIPAGTTIDVAYSMDGIYRTWGGVTRPLAAGASITIGTQGVPYTIPTGTHTIMAWVDDENRFAEANETNNKLTQSITIGTPTPTPTPTTTTTTTTTPPTTTSARGAAFPGAQGGGASSKGGRGGVIMEVTNLNDSGTGSLRACAEASGPRTCVFRVGGTINLLRGITIRSPFITIAGQTAPGGGIMLSGKNSTDALLWISTNNVTIRYLRFRKGYNSGCLAGAQCGSNVNMNGAATVYDVVLDHCSLTWNQDDGIGPWTIKNNVTLSWNIVAEGLKGHATGIITGSASNTTAENMTDVDIHHTLLMNNTHRGPFLGGASSREVNNINYNHASHATQLYGGIRYDGINNIKKRGPLSGTSFYEYEGLIFSSGTDASLGSPSMYLSGNIGWNQTNTSGDQWAMARQVSSYNGPPTGTIPTSWRRTSPLPATAFPIIPEPTSVLEANLLPIVGASRRLDCNGNWVANRDAVDVRLINQYKTNTGNNFLVSSETQVGGFPVIAGGTPCADADHDGMPDVWETARGLNPNNAADRNTVATNGYTNLENYLGGV